MYCSYEPKTLFQEGNYGPGAASPKVRVHTPDRGLGARPRGGDDPAPTLQAPPTFSAVKMAARFAGECLPFSLFCALCVSVVEWRRGCRA